VELAPAINIDVLARLLGTLASALQRGRAAESRSLGLAQDNLFQVDAEASVTPFRRR